jgi:Sec-independent protein translocase protein TatA
MKHITSLVNEAFKHRLDLLEGKYGPIITDQMKNKVKIAIDQVGIAVKNVADELGSTLGDVREYIKTIEHDLDRELDVSMSKIKTEQQEKDELIKRDEEFKAMKKDLDSKSKELDATIAKQTQAE